MIPCGCWDRNHCQKAIIGTATATVTERKGDDDGARRATMTEQEGRDGMKLIDGATGTSTKRDDDEAKGMATERDGARGRDGARWRDGVRWNEE